MRCEVSLNDNDCEAPANLENPDRSVETRCYRCGQRACRSCSTVQPGRVRTKKGQHWRRIRVCRDCFESRGD